MSNNPAADLLTDEELFATEEDAVRAAIEERLKDLHTSLPGKIVSFNAAKQTAVVQPQIQRIWVDDGALDLPAIPDVPVHFPRGGGFVLTFPVSPGDECLLVFGERAIDNWFANSGSQPPSEYRLHDLSDAFALVGFSSVPKALTNVADDATELRTLDGTTMFRLEAGTAYVGGKAGANRAVMGDAYRQSEASLNNTLLVALNTLNVLAQNLNSDPIELAAFSALYPLREAFLIGIQTMLPLWIAALTEFESGAPAYLAKQAKVR